MRGARSDINMEDLAHRMSALEEDAFLQFSNIFGPRFRKIFVNRGLNLTDAEELAVSCVTDIALKVEQYRSSQGHFEAWVFTLARHCLIDWWRNRHPSAQLSDELLEVPFADETPKPNFELVSAVNEAMKRLSENDRTVIRAKNMGGESTFADVSRQIGITAGATRVRHLRALKRLETLLAEDHRIKVFLKKRKVVRKEK